MYEDKKQKIIQNYLNKINNTYINYVNNLYDSFENLDENFSISVIEEKIENSCNNVQDAFIDVTSEILNSVNEDELIIKKKENI